jgi:hypothetical protein
MANASTQSDMCVTASAVLYRWAGYSRVVADTPVIAS